MGSADSTSARVLRMCLLFALVIYGFGFWVNRALAFTDFRVLHLAGRLLNDGKAETAYDPAAFLAEAANDPYLAETARELDVFISPPPFGLFIRPFALLPSQAALVVWLAVGVLGIVGAVRLLRLPWWSSIVALIMPFGIANIYHAQTGFLAVLWVAAIHRLSVDDRPVAAGLVAGLAVLKPTLLLGVALWWLLDWRRWYPALSAALAMGTAIVGATVLAGFEQWRLFFGALDARSALDQDVMANQPTIGEVMNRAFGTDIGSHPIALVAYVTIGALAMFVAMRRWHDNTAALSGFAMLLSVLISPHMLIYDTGVLLVPVAVLFSAGAAIVTIERLTMVYVVTSLTTILSIGWLGTLNGWTIPGTFGVVFLAGLWVRAIDRTSTHADDASGLELVEPGTVDGGQSPLAA